MIGGRRGEPRRGAQRKLGIEHDPKRLDRIETWKTDRQQRIIGQSRAAADQDRIMQRLVRTGSYHPGLKFFFECGTEDESEDRNGNGIIDSIDDTMDLISALIEKGYKLDKDITYIEIPGGRHDVDTWAKVIPQFLANKKPRQ